MNSFMLVVSRKWGRSCKDDLQHVQHFRNIQTLVSVKGRDSITSSNWLREKDILYLRVKACGKTTYYSS